MMHLLANYINAGRNSVSSIISQWSPASGQGNSQESTDNYIRSVAHELGVSPNATLTAADIPRLASAMSAFEGDRNGQPGVGSIHPNQLAQPIADIVFAPRATQGYMLDALQQRRNDAVAYLNAARQHGDIAGFQEARAQVYDANAQLLDAFGGMAMQQFLASGDPTGYARWLHVATGQNFGFTYNAEHGTYQTTIDGRPTGQPMDRNNLQFSIMYTLNDHFRNERIQHDLQLDTIRAEGVNAANVASIHGQAALLSAQARAQALVIASQNRAQARTVRFAQNPSGNPVMYFVNDQGHLIAMTLGTANDTSPSATGQRGSSPGLQVSAPRDLGAVGVSNNGGGPGVASDDMNDLVANDGA
jgi:hypothetical protein